MEEDQQSPTNPAGTSLAAVEASLRDDGYTGQFRAQESGDLVCLTCRGSFPASSVDADEVRRLEGASDPADMLVVIPIVCPVCDAAGSLIANYGPEASIEEAAVLLAMEREPSEGDDLDEPAPGATSTS